VVVLHARPSTANSIDDGKSYTVRDFERARFEHHPEKAGTPYEVLLGFLGKAFHPPDAAVKAASDARFFPETGQTVGPPFLADCEAHGGLGLNGYPLSPAFTATLEDGRPYLVQYFERVRLEHHPENAAPYDILLGQFGRRILAGIAGAPTAPAIPRPDYAYFASTGHNVRPAFFAYWERNSGLAQFGLPLGEEFAETLEDGRSYTVQYFERARFEWHPEHAGTPYEVLLGQFGRRILGER